MNMNDVINVVKNAIEQVNADWKEHIGDELVFRGLYEKNGWIFFDIGTNLERNMALTRRRTSAIYDELIQICRSAGVRVSAVRFRDLYLEGKKIKLGIFSLLMRKSKIDEAKMKIQELKQIVKELNNEEKKAVIEELEKLLIELSQ